MVEAAARETEIQVTDKIRLSQPFMFLLVVVVGLTILMPLMLVGAVVAVRERAHTITGWRDILTKGTRGVRE
jgi:hypothetical protein